MKNLIALIIVTATLPLSARAQSYFGGGFGRGGGNTQATLRIKPDGSSLLTSESTEQRDNIENQIKFWNRYSAGDSDGASDLSALDPDTGLPASAVTAQKPDQKPLTDDELKAKLKQMYEAASELGDESVAQNIESIDLTSNSVHIVSTRAFPSLKDLLGANVYLWGPGILMPESARIETDTNQNLRITFASNPQTARYAKTMVRQYKSRKTSSTWKLVLPGKILSSSLPVTRDNTTSIALDTGTPETIDATVKLIGSPLTITAEPAGLKLDQPLDSKTLVRHFARANNSTPDLPITDAGPGFVAEPVSVTLSTVHYFPEGEKLFKDRPETSLFGFAQTGAVVSAKLFPPKGREIKSVSNIHLKSAKDDQGRIISGQTIGSGDADAGSDEAGATYSGFTSYDLGESGKPGAARLDLRLALPAPDAKTIEELQAEAVALTIGSWKEMLLTNVQADAKKEIDLGEIMPGAKLIIKKTSNRSAQKTVEATLEGPLAVNQLDLKIKTRGRGAQSHMTDRRSKTSGDKTTRGVNVQGFDFDESAPAGGSSGPIDLIIRAPQDMKRERVQIKLTALDLL
jgi:hypothetical protein